MIHQRSVFIDANALTLFILGSIDLANIGRHKRISAYSREEYDIVAYYILGEDSGYTPKTCPNALTEVDNLCNRQKGAHRRIYQRLMQNVSVDVAEVYLESKIAIQDNVSTFTELGLTDTVFLHLARQDDLLITGDSRLADFARSQDIPVVDLKAIVTQRISR